MEKLFLSRKEFASALGVSLATVDRGIRNRQYPYNAYKKIGKRVLYPTSILNELQNIFPHTNCGATLTEGIA